MARTRGRASGAEQKQAASSGQRRGQSLLPFEALPPTKIEVRCELQPSELLAVGANYQQFDVNCRQFGVSSW
jgi:hypothetical protein